MAHSPSVELVPPHAIDPVPDLVENIVGGTQYLSATWWFGWAVQQSTGTDPWQWCAENFAGDWQAVSRAAAALDNLASFNASFGAELNKRLLEVGRGWRGDASERAGEYFEGLVGAVREQVSCLEGLASEFRTMAVGMYETANALKGLFVTLLDLLIAIGLEAAAAATLGWTVIGPVLSGAAAAATITKAMGVWGQILEVHSHAWTAVQAFVGVCAGYLGGLDAPTAQPYPAGAYQSQGG